MSLKSLITTYSEEPPKRLTRIKISKAKIKARGSDKPKLEFEPAFDYSKSLKNSEAMHRPASALKIINKKEIVEPVMSKAHPHGRKLKLKSKKKLIVESQVNFYPSTNYFYKTQSEVGSEKDDDTEVPNRQVGEVKNYRMSEQVSSASSNNEKDSKNHFLTLDD